VNTPDANCANAYIRVRTWNFTDGCGNTSANFVQTITVIDSIAPSLIGTIPSGQSNMNLCFANIPVGPSESTIMALYSDNCGGAVTVTKSGTPTGNSCDWSVTYTYQVKDACGNILNPSPTVTYSGGDKTNPVIVCPTVPLSVWPNSGPNYTQTGTSWDATATDNCSTPTVVFTLSGATTSPNNLTTLNGVTFNYGLTIVTWTATDSCGNSSSCSYSINVADNTVPQISCPPRISVTCINLIPPAYTSLAEFIAAGGTVSDNSGLDSASFTLISQTSDGRTCPEMITRIYQIADIVGNVNQCAQFIIVDDNIAPTFTRPADITIYKDNSCSFDASPSITGNVSNIADNCDTNSTASYTDKSCFGNNNNQQMNHGQGYYFPVTISGFNGINASNVGKVELEFHTNQGKGNIEMILVAPSGDAIMLVGPYCTGSTECDFQASNTYNPSFYPASSGYTKWVNSNYIAPGEGIFTPNGGASVENTYGTITGFNGNWRTKFEDIQGPMNGNWVLYGRKGGSDVGTIDFISLCISPISCPDDDLIVRTWTVTDHCGNASNSQTQLILIKDSLAPTLTMPQNITVNNDPTLCGAYVTIPQPIAHDNCGIATLVNSINGTAIASGFYLVGTTTISWTATDRCGNSSNGTMTVTVIDNEVPVISCPTDVVSCSANITLGTPTATDNCAIASVLSNAPTTFPIGVTTIVTWTATDIHGNISSCNQSVTISEMTASASGSSQVSCHNSADGVITVTAHGGTGAYSYSLNGATPQASNIFNGLAAGSYTVIVRDVSGCSATTNAVIIANPELLTATAVGSSQVSCFGEKDGIITVTAHGGTGTYNYSLNGATPQTSNIFNGLAAGSYTVVVRDKKECTVTTNAVIIANPALLTASAQGPSQVSCYNAADGVITVTANGGTGAYSYSLNGSTPHTNNIFSGLAAGSYTVVVHDANGCSATTNTVIITNPTLLTASAVGSSQVGCNDAADGVITVTANGGTGAYSYSLNGGTPQASNIFSGLIAGIYTAIVRDINGCSAATVAVTISNPSLLTASAIGSSQVSCNNASDGIITVTTTGGTGTLSYSLNGGNPQTSNVFNDLPSGTYSVVVRDTNGCLATTNTVIIANPTLLTASAEGSSQVSCNNAADGIITVTAHGGTGAYSYSLNGGTPQASNIFGGLIAGSYTVIVRDVKGCSATTNAVIIANPKPLEVSAEGSSQVSCNNAADGIITVTAHGGTGAYSYSLNGGTPQESNIFGSLIAGSYTVIVYDGKGCSATTNAVIIANPTLLTASAVGSPQTSCYSVEDGIITVTAHGGTGAYSYSLNGGTPQASNIFSGLAAGTYTIVVRDANECSVTTNTVIIAKPELLTASVEGSSQVSCFNVADGIITVTAAGGTGIYSYSLNDGPPEASNIFSGLAAGTYTVTVRDVNGCSVTTKAITITNPELLTASAVGSSQVSCFDVKDGIITVTAHGGTGAYSYSLNGDTPQTSNIFSGLVAGTYTVVVRDINGCSATTGAVVIENPLLLAISIESSPQVSCNGASDGTIAVSVSGGTGVYSYSLNGAEPQASNIFSGLAAGTYTVIVRDANGCSATSKPITIANPQRLTAMAEGSSQVSCNGSADGLINVTPHGGTPPYSFSLNGGIPQSIGTFSGLISGIYSVVVRDVNNCSVTTEVIEIINPRKLTVEASASDPSCNNSSDGQIIITAFGGTGNYLYALNDGEFQGSNIFSHLSSGTYLVKVKDGNSCTTQIEKAIFNPGEIIVTASGTTAVSCSGASDGRISISAEGGTGHFTYSINGIDFQESSIFTNLGPGGYNITVLDANGCMGKISFAINSQEPIAISLLSKLNAECGAAGGAAEIGATGGTPPYRYEWSNGTQGASANGLTNGAYDITVTDANGCPMTYQNIKIELDGFVEISPTNVFTPNEDGIYDTWTIKNIDLYPDNELVVINRWGNEVYSTKGYKNENGWNGSQLNEGTYFFVLKVNMCGEERKYTGYITIIK